MGMSHSEVRGLEQLFAREEYHWGSYMLAQWDPLDNIDILLLAADNPLVMGKWQEMQSRRLNPDVVYICNRDSKIQDLEILLNACFRPIRKKSLLEALEALEVVAEQFMGSGSAKIAV